jgi:RNA polymerase sigma-70 factor (family 1)
VNLDVKDIDKTIIDRIAQADEQAFEAFVTYFGPQIQHAIFQVVRTPEPVKDILQDVFLNIWIARERLPELQSPRTWLFRIAYYRSYTWLKKQAVRDRVHHTIDEKLLKEMQRSPVEEQSTFEETRRFLHQAIEELPTQAKKIYQLSREQNLSVSEIAEQLDLSPQTVKNTISTALKSIRKNLQDKGIMLPAIILALTFYKIF